MASMASAYSLFGGWAYLAMGGGVILIVVGTFQGWAAGDGQRNKAQTRDLRDTVLRRLCSAENAGP
jgi:hypothetical protein